MSPTMMFLLILLSAIAVVASSGLPATNADSSLSSLLASLDDQNSNSNTKIASVVIRHNQMEVGSSCLGLEGEWNCMATTFQRCASGHWSVVLDTAYGTVCKPEGFTYDFQPAFASWFPTGDTTQTIVCTETAKSTSGSTDKTHTPSSGAPMVGDAASRSVIWTMLLGLTSTALLFLAV